jgi:Serine endopeptidase inhibitors
MSNVKFEDLAPAPFFARFLEGQSIKEMTREELKSVCGGTAVTMAAPSVRKACRVASTPRRLEI